MSSLMLYALDLELQHLQGLSRSLYTEADKRSLILKNGLIVFMIVQDM